MEELGMTEREREGKLWTYPERSRDKECRRLREAETKSVGD